jgi:hypothetical protein
LPKSNVGKILRRELRTNTHWIWFSKSLALRLIY